MVVKIFESNLQIYSVKRVYDTILNISEKNYKTKIIRKNSYRIKYDKGMNQIPIYLDIRKINTSF